MTKKENKMRLLFTAAPSKLCSVDQSVSSVSREPPKKWKRVKVESQTP